MTTPTYDPKISGVLLVGPYNDSGSGGAPVDWENAARVWCIVREYPRANWGIAGVPFAPGGYVSASDAIQYKQDRPLA
jgi:hypothetical protein